MILPTTIRRHLNDANVINPIINIVFRKTLTFPVRFGEINADAQIRLGVGRINAPWGWTDVPCDNPMMFSDEVKRRAELLLNLPEDGAAVVVVSYPNCQKKATIYIWQSTYEALMLAQSVINDAPDKPPANKTELAWFADPLLSAVEKICSILGRCLS
jgi:hypothetical protein